MEFPTRPDSNRPVQSQKQVRSLKFWIYEEEELYYPCIENKDADQLCSYCTADLRLCSRTCRLLLIFSCGGSFVNCQLLHLNRRMGKPTICICENKGADQLRGNQRLCFRYTDRTINPKFPASSHIQRLYSPVCVGPVRKAHCWFSHEAAHLFSIVSDIHICCSSFFLLLSPRFVCLSYDVAVFQWITSCHKNRMTTRVLTLLRDYVTSLTTSVITIQYNTIQYNTIQYNTIQYNNFIV